MPGYRVMVTAGKGVSTHAVMAESGEDRWAIFGRRTLCGLKRAVAFDWKHEPDCKLCRRAIKGRRLGRVRNVKL